jgi:phage repressor protein C with HTH and peptisase S24 domain
MAIRAMPWRHHGGKKYLKPLQMVYKGILQSQDHNPTPFEASRRLFVE